MIVHHDCYFYNLSTNCADLVAAPSLMVLVLVLQSLLQDMESRRPRLEKVLSTGEQLQQTADSETDRVALKQQGGPASLCWSHPFLCRPFVTLPVSTFCHTSCIVRLSHFLCRPFVTLPVSTFCHTSCIVRLSHFLYRTFVTLPVSTFCHTSCVVRLSHFLCRPFVTPCRERVTLPVSSMCHASCVVGLFTLSVAYVCRPYSWHSLCREHVTLPVSAVCHTCSVSRL